jgi:hypothetical protein
LTTVASDTENLHVVARILAVSTLALVIAVGNAPPSAVAQASRRCPDFHIGPAYYSNIRAVGVGCPRARRLLDKTMLSTIRRGREQWSYGGFRWRLTRIDEVSGRVVGRKGTRTIRCVFAVG